MTPIKKLEIVTASVEIGSVARLLDELGVSGYTIVRGVEGRGGRGRLHGDELTGASGNSYLMAACPAEDVPRIVDAVRPVLARVGGVALVSDALWVRH
jgi:nitrogen regulatory protein PII